MFANVKEVSKLTDFVHRIWVKPKNGPWKNITVLDSFVSSSDLFYAAYCFTLSNDFVQLEIIFKQMIGVSSVNLFFKDTLRLVHRALPEHDLAYIGGRDMKLLLSAGESTLFNIEVSQNVNIEKDTTTNCKNYPTIEHKNYGECDRKYVLARMKDLFGPNFVPLWAAENTSQVGKLKLEHKLECSLHRRLGRFSL